MANSVDPDEKLGSLASQGSTLFSQAVCQNTYSIYDTHYVHLISALLMSTHNICFCTEIRKIITCLYVFPLSPIMKTCLNNFDPLKPHFYIVKLGFTRVYIIFHISAQNIDCGYSLEPP